jgi:hypothetical protein
MRPVEGTILTVVREAAEAAPVPPPRGQVAGRGARGRPRRGATRWPARPSCCRCSPRPAWSTPAAPGSCSCSTPPARGRRPRRSRAPPTTRASSASTPHSSGPPAPRSRRPRRRRPALRGHVLPRGPRRHHPGVQGRVGRHRRLHRGGRRRRHLELPHPHRRHRRRHRGGDRHRAAPQDPGHRPAREVEEERWVREGAASAAARPRHRPSRSPPRSWRVATGDGVQRIFHSLGVRRVVTGGQSMNPSTAQLLEAVEAAPGRPGRDPAQQQEHHPVAEQVDAQTAKSVRVVPTALGHRGLRRPAGLRPRGTSRRQRRLHVGRGG